jgi:hypothetical protein
MDRPRYAWTVDGVVKAGTLADYASDLNLGDFYGVPVGRELWDGNRMVHVHIAQSRYDAEDYSTVHVTVREPYDYASFRIDGRA